MSFFVPLQRQMAATAAAASATGVVVQQEPQRAVHITTVRGEGASQVVANGDVNLTQSEHDEAVQR